MNLFRTINVLALSAFISIPSLAALTKEEQAVCDGGFILRNKSEKKVGVYVENPPALVGKGEWDIVDPGGTLTKSIDYRNKETMVRVYSLVWKEKSWSGSEGYATDQLLTKAKFSASSKTLFINLSPNFKIYPQKGPLSGWTYATDEGCDLYKNGKLKATTNVTQDEIDSAVAAAK